MTSSRQHTKWGFTVLFGVLGSLIVGLFLLAFLWPVATAAPNGLKVAISGPAQTVSTLKGAIAKQTGGALSFTEVSGRSAAVSSIRNRDVYGAIVLAPQPEVLTASAANSSVAQLLDTAAGQLQNALQAQAPGVTVKTTDVVPLSSDDASGAGITAMSIPLVLGGMIGGVLISLLVVGAVRRVVALLVYGAAAGLLTVLIGQTRFGFLQGGFFADWAVLSLAMLATAAAIVGLNALLGRGGIALGAVLTIWFALPVSGSTVPTPFLPSPWGSIGQLFVPGAGSTLVRTLSYFPDASGAQQWVVLGAWAVGGLLLTFLGHFRNAAPVSVPEAELEPAAEAVPV
ncbi:hypothetical protein [Gryllotalpicola protaetiae]|uniref:ABC transporter permease n=1 Tax=Gryllotalpicola protaetiae TaxID=2419771 RepID=A0A387BR71_9MICO|nr:hypothetical protein [Gryllotalpicola protaetiae]AYG03476.1 hypothetical protein D7I44_07965 [Gryllotalpicola protaetiae]